MSPYIKRLVKELGVEEAKATQAWNKALEVASDMYGKRSEKFSMEEFQFAYDTAINILKKQEIRHSIADFIESGKSAEEYIELVMSGQFSPSILDEPIKKKDKDDDEEEENVVYEGTDDEDDSEDDDDADMDDSDDDLDDDDDSQEDDDDDTEDDEEEEIEESVSNDKNSGKITEKVKEEMTNEEIQALKAKLKSYLESSEE